MNFVGQQILFRSPDVQRLACYKLERTSQSVWCQKVGAKKESVPELYHVRILPQQLPAATHFIRYFHNDDCQPAFFVAWFDSQQTIDMSKEEEEEEEARQMSFLLRVLFNDDDEYTQTGFELQPPGSNKRNSGKYTRITRIPQLDTWDCGIACLLMIHQWLRNERNEEAETIHNYSQANTLERKTILSDVGTESIWTSDLMMQLHSWKTNHKANNHWWSFVPWFEESRISKFTFVLASKQIMGADESYRDFQYYKNAFEDDRSRVSSTFRDLLQKQVPMLQTAAKGLAMSTVIEIIEQEDCLAIILLDNNILLQGRSEKSNISDSHGSKTDCRPYSGHYAILCGTSNDPKHVEIANSGEETTCSKETTNTSEKFCFVLCNPDPCHNRDGSNYAFVTPERLEASWRADGTDEDIIFLRKISKS